MNKIIKKRKISLAASVCVVLLAVLLVFLSAVPASAAAAADVSTLDKWSDTTGKDTKNIGRIWTDKTVSTENVKLPGGSEPTVAKGDSDFLVTLSALSSAGKITGERTSVKPLDIVLVLDTSGSMGDNLSSTTTYTYREVYSNRVGERGTYYAKVEGSDGTEEYVPITNKDFNEWWEGGSDYGYELNGQRVYPKENINDTSANHIQFYTQERNTVRLTKMQALKNAANAFIDSTAKENETISDNSKKHSISLVTFADNAQKRYDLTICNNENAAAIKSTVNGLRANGATAADSGMVSAKSVLEGESAREDAQKIVIFFTDGEPNHQSGFDNRVANDTISTAKALKEKATRVYSIGMFSAADPNDESTDRHNRFNAYMHGVSSNYPSAIAWNNLGERATDSEGNKTAFYKSADNADDLNKVFDEIFTEINTIDPTSPVEENVNGTENMEAITFHDELGDYMKVDDFKAIVFADTKYENPQKATNGNIDTYTFTADVDGGMVYPSGNLNTIKITVERSENLEKGDKVTVVIPASMIPLREYVIDTRDNSKSMTIDETYPLRLFYGASLKDGVKDELANPDETLQAYIDANKDNQGQLNFYSNKYYKDGTNNGGVYVEFEPNDTNDFYYFQEDEILYTGTAPANPGGEPGDKQVATGTLDTSGDTIYYYDRLYYSLENGKPIEKHNWVQIPGNSNLPLSGFVKKNADGELYIPMGTPRTTSLETHALNKTETSNKTGTAPYITAPNWDNLQDPKNVIVKLGNNGLLKVDLPGTLEIAKMVNAVNGTPDADAKFKFDITLDGDNVKDSYTMQKFNAAGTAEGEAETITFTDKKATVELKAGEKIQVHGLAAGTGYTVTEQEVADDGFTLSNTENGTGTIASGVIAAARFTNEYRTGELKIQAEDFGLKGNKYITGENRQFEEGDIFKFDITASDAAPDSPVPETGASAIIEPTSGTEAEISFGEFVFDKAGHYRYSIKEYLPTGSGSEDYDKIIPGITYDTTNYRLTLDVVDNGNGELVATNVHIDKNSGEAGDTVWTPVYPADGKSGAGLPEGNPEYLEFTNTYAANEQTVSLMARKEMNKLLTDYSMKEQFGFVVEAGGSRTAGSSDAFAANDKQPMPTDADGKYIYRNDTTGVITIPHITFTPDNAPDDGSKVEYLYKIRELQPTDNGKFEGKGIEGATKVNGKWTYKGVTFDSEVKEVKVTAWSESKEVDGVTTHVVNVTIDYGNSNNQHTFVNEYNASVETSITGTKKITGRAFKNDDAFTFNITAKDGAPLPVDAGGNELNSVTIKPDTGSEATINCGTFKFDQDDILGEDGQATGATKTVDGNGHASYTKTFKYTITEADTDINGIAYDTKPKELSITVKDNGFGNMTVEESALSDSTWINDYTASMTLSDGIEISKTLTGRAMNPGEFTFSITPEGDAPVLGGSDRRFTNTTWTAAGQANVMKKLTSLKFTQNDAGKEYTYVIDEVEGNAGNGITYDKSQYKAVITVTDNGEGTLSAETKFYRTMDKEGNAVTDSVNPEAPGVKVDAIAFNNSYAVRPGTLSGENNLMVTKEFTGRPNDEWLDTDSFNFKLELTGTPEGYQDGDVVMPKETTVTINNDDKNNGYKDSFGDITFNKTGTYTFTVSEVTDGLSNKGITCTTEPKTVTIVVTDPGTGTLVATKADTSQALHFINEYKAGATGFTGINVEKTLNGRDWKESDSFTFKLEGNDDATKKAIEAGDVNLPNPAEVEIKGTDQSKTKAFEAITFTKVGEYSFKVTEVVSADEDKIPGITYDTSEKIINIKVTDGTDGNMIIKVKSIDDSSNETLSDSTKVTFTNTYATLPDATAAFKNLSVRKTLTGREWKDGEIFKFELILKNAGDEAKVELPASTRVEIKNDTADFTAAFGDIKFKAAGEYTFVITEENAGETIDGVTYAEPQEVTIKVADDTNGGLTATVDGIDEKTVEFVNKYAPEGSGSAETNGLFSKVIEGRDWKTKDEFTFKIEAQNGGPLPANATTIVTSNNKDSFGFGTIIFTKDDMVDAEGNAVKEKTFTYKVTEENAGKTVKGLTYSSEAAIISITVTDDNTGQLLVEDPVIIDGTGETVPDAPDQADSSGVFTNVYKGAFADTTDKFTKAIDTRNWQTGDEFTFTLSPQNEAPIPVDGTTVKVISTSAAAGEKVPFGFGKIEFTAEDMTGAVETEDPDDGNILQKTFTYNITENDIASTVKPDTVKDDHTATMTITVTLNKDTGKLQVAGIEVKDGDFVNKYTEPVIPTAETTISGSKVLQNITTGKAETFSAGRFTFVLTPQNGQAIELTNDDNGSFAYQLHLPEGTHTYTLTEKENDSSITFDKSVYKIVITVAPNDAGELTATQTITKTHGADGTELETPETPTEIKFTNTCESKPVDPPTPSRPDNGSISLTAQKILSGRDLAAGEFSFAVVDASGKTVATGSNKADGSINFSKIIFTEARVYEYDVKEINNNLGGVTYDDTLYHVQIIVQNVGGKLTPTSVQYKIVSGQAVSALVFNNVYKPGETGLSIGGTKILEGRKLKAGEFTFILKGEGGKTYKVVNDADGRFIFDDLVFDKAGTYVYRLYEQKGKDKEITYDSEEFLITVTVTDDLKGNLNASYVVTKNGEEVDAVAFTNTYEKAEEPDKPVTPDKPEKPDDSKEPKTGDESMLFMWVLLLITASGAAGAAVALKKRQDR